MDCVYQSQVLCKADDTERERERHVLNFNGKVHDTVITGLEYYNNTL